MVSFFGVGVEDKRYISGMIDGLIGCSSKAETQSLDDEKKEVLWCINVDLERFREKCIISFFTKRSFMLMPPLILSQNNINMATTTPLCQLDVCSNKSALDHGLSVCSLLIKIIHVKSIS